MVTATEWPATRLRVFQLPLNSVFHLFWSLLLQVVFCLLSPVDGCPGSQRQSLSVIGSFSPPVGAETETSIQRCLHFHVRNTGNKTDKMINAE